MVDANRMATTPYDLSFRVDRNSEVICVSEFNEDALAKFRRVSGCG